MSQPTLSKFLLLAPSILFALALGACGDGADTMPAAMSVRTSSFPDGGSIPVRYAAPAKGGLGISPQLSVGDLPGGTATLAILMDDETPPCGNDDRACIHWGAFNIPAIRTSFVEGQDFGTIPGVVLGAAYNNQIGYQGPNPLASTHTYTITVFALGAGAPTLASRPTPKLTRSEFESMYGGFILGQASLTGSFTP